MRVNVEGVFLITRAAMPRLLAAKGTALGIGFVSGLVAVKRRFADCATKPAVVTLSLQLAIGYAVRLRVNCVCPGAMETPFVEAFLENSHKRAKEKVRAGLHARQPVGRMGPH
jgi:NAD(P)-dependent dehydrogenase (short-subunit alcohol dehydrogenase family)